jgi:hypothetical protein
VFRLVGGSICNRLPVVAMTESLMELRPCSHRPTGTIDRKFVMSDFWTESVSSQEQQDVTANG